MVLQLRPHHAVALVYCRIAHVDCAYDQGRLVPFSGRLCSSRLPVWPSEIASEFGRSIMRGRRTPSSCFRGPSEAWVALSHHVIQADSRQPSMGEHPVHSGGFLAQTHLVFLSGRYQHLLSRHPIKNRFNVRWMNCIPSAAGIFVDPNQFSAGDLVRIHL